MVASPVESEVKEVVQQAIEKHGKSPDALIPVLSEINRALGYVPAEAIREVKRQIHNPAERTFAAESQLYGLVSFYDMLSTQPRGRHVIKFCENAPCHVVGGKAIWDALRETLQLKNGETTPDKKWTLVTTSCIGLCSVGPVLLVDDDMYGNFTVEQIPDILERYE
ncbi:MAG: NAD(P)H-dependent oxidoreductase subunit E [Anaerolineales bacterium]|nr:NAD(P)H-dependent oxidoreductase subunit E [Anaerolineales bacterium]